VAHVVRAGEAAATAVAAGDLGRLLTSEHGKVLWEAEFDALTPGAIAAVFGAMADEALTPTVTGASAVEHVPYGVVAAVLPFNWPVSVLAMKVVPALLAGNCVVVKAPPSCPLAVLAVADAMAAALPDGVLNALNAPGPEFGEALVTHPGIDMVSFTGGIPTGRAVMAAASRRITPLVLELGGNDAAIVAPDVDITEALADRLHDAAFLTAGQVCMAVKRLYVPEERVGEMVEALVTRTAADVVGHGLDEGVTMGPVHSERSRDFVEALIAEAAETGASVHRPAEVRDDARAGGWFVSPAIVERPAPYARVVREEQFGPVLPVLGYRDLDDAVAQANDDTYGLCASVWTNDDALADSLAQRLEAGVVWVNHHGTAAVDPAAPFGGWKQSGFGRELGPDGIRAYTRTRSVTRHTLP